ncbi:hypothetical protein OUZ56_012347 [Daphnia magna]|uniref:Uncharacterized protein n=1 Tax=Daphnia magna TaxID=35525 RepID=A0ABQ9Z2R5_9CRUS|nr:hypothetical protein OUZ56_012347 [Daphnia magna]
MADILAYIQMGYVTEMFGERHVDTILVHPGQANEISFTARVGYWLRNFGALSGVGVSIAYFNPCCWLTPPKSIRGDIEMGPQVNSGTIPSAPVTIVNIPAPPTPAGANAMARPGMNHQPPPPALQTFLFPFTDEREDQKGGQAAWIPDPDEEDILYYVDYSSDMEEFRYMATCPADEEDILYCADNPFDDETLYDADVLGTSTLILDPAALLQDRASPYCLSPASDIQERAYTSLNDRITRFRGEKCNVSVVSSYYSLGSDEEDLAKARYVERTYRILSQRDHGYRNPALEWKGFETDVWSEEEENWPRSSIPKLDKEWSRNRH